MDAGVLDAVRALLDTERVLTLAVLVDGEPVAALLPFAVSLDRTAVLVQASGLARHARGLTEGASVGVAIHQPATADRDPMQIPRLTVQGTVRVLERGSAAFVDAAERLTARFPAAAVTLTLPDFHLSAIALGRGRYVEGFARAVNIGPDTFRALVS
ncbi:MAG TPA: pyridoxamine 5'-phosphate oxidase family protein [Vicinamibacterales bacterium]|nr:pyridoxamine 5'-phosphate oxidase family protein [Vicinamibacterales bacterium]